MNHQAKNSSIQSTKVWIQSVYLFPKQHPCPFKFYSKNLKQPSMLGWNFELNPGTNIRYPFQILLNQTCIACDKCAFYGTTKPTCQWTLTSISPLQIHHYHGCVKFVIHQITYQLYQMMTNVAHCMTEIAVWDPYKNKTRYPN